MHRIPTRAITPAELKLAASMLGDYSENLSNNSCNDFRLDDHLPDVEDRRRFMHDFHEYNGDPEEFDASRDYKLTMDSMVAQFLASWLEHMANEAEQKLR